MAQRQGESEREKEKSKESKNKIRDVYACYAFCFQSGVYEGGIWA